MVYKHSVRLRYLPLGSSKRVRLCIQGAFNPESKVLEISREEQLGLHIPEASLIAVDNINVSALFPISNNGRDTMQH